MYVYWKFKNKEYLLVDEAEFQCNVPDPRNSRKPLTCALYAQYKVWDIQ